MTYTHVTSDIRFESYIIQYHIIQISNFSNLSVFFIVPLKTIDTTCTGLNESIIV